MGEMYVFWVKFSDLRKRQSRFRQKTTLGQTSRKKKAMTCQIIKIKST